MSTLISTNVRFALWRQGIPRAQWVSWLAGHCELYPAYIREVIERPLPDEEIGEADCVQLARAINMSTEPESLRFIDHAHDGCDVLKENLLHLLDSLEHGGKKLLANKIGVDPTTISRWLNGTSQPSEATLRQVAAYFGIPSSTNLRTDPVFLSREPVALTERKEWLVSCVRDLSVDEFRELYPALRRMLERK